MKMLFLDKEKYEGLTKKAEALRDNLEQEEKKADDAYKELAQSIIDKYKNELQNSNALAPYWPMAPFTCYAEYLAGEVDTHFRNMNIDTKEWLGKCLDFLPKAEREALMKKIKPLALAWAKVHVKANRARKLVIDLSHIKRALQELNAITTFFGDGEDREEVSKQINRIFDICIGETEELK